MLSPEQANSASTRRIVTSVVCGDDFVPRTTPSAMLRTQRSLVHLLDRLEGDSAPAASAADDDGESASESAKRTLSGASRRLLRLWALLDYKDNAFPLAAQFKSKLEESAGTTTKALAPPPELLDSLDRVLSEPVRGPDERDLRRSREIDSLFQQLVQPGRRLWLRRLGKTEDGDDFEALELAPKSVLSVRLSEKMITDHKTELYGESIRASLRALGVHDF
eukprot:TRINITY_DN7574_c0_g1_i1.p1 TRINITY_DN7574_c0_g1~~TRINITY_DN7574_c0_g1_i1.p1  ORF type:complete len:221 (-),score=63.47 TRINITY_DN7574_c0_g1_i1:24-686(-)